MPIASTKTITTNICKTRCRRTKSFTTYYSENISWNIEVTVKVIYQ